jgi:UDP-N-acetylmuramoylalanine--D-glutamate ligase
MIVFPDFAGQKFAVLGFGKSGQATARALRVSQADVTVWDEEKDAQKKIKQEGYTLRDLMKGDISGLQAIVVSPGVQIFHPKPHPIVARAKQAGVALIGEMDLLFHACPNATYIGVTGTNGKSTTAALIGHVLRESKRRVQTGGGASQPMLACDPLGVDGLYVLEMSAFQLDLMQENKIGIAVVLNVAPDRSDQASDMVGYVASKRKIVNRNGPQRLIIGTDETESLFLKNESQKLSKLVIEEISLTHEVTKGYVVKDGVLFGVSEDQKQPLLNLGDLEHLSGLHNAQNVAAAFAACRDVGVQDDQIAQSLKSFPGLPHRQEFVAEFDGIRFINDSKATNAASAAKALASFDNIYWIVGGMAKAGGLTGLESYMPRVRHAFLIGDASEAFAKWLNGKADYSACATMEKAVESAVAAARKCKKGKPVVLLSPACASFDQYAGFEERGEKFVSLIAGYKEMG